MGECWLGRCQGSFKSLWSLRLNMGGGYVYIHWKIHWIMYLRCVLLLYYAYWSHVTPELKKKEERAYLENLKGAHQIFLSYFSFIKILILLQEMHIPLIDRQTGHKQESLEKKRTHICYTHTHTYTHTYVNIYACTRLGGRGEKERNTSQAAL